MELLLQLLFVITIFALATNSNETSVNNSTTKVKLEGPVKFHDKNKTILVHNGVPYAKGEFWKEDDDYFVVPCDVNACIRQCSEELARKANFTLPKKDFQVEVHHEGEMKTVGLHDHFHVLKEVECENPYSLVPEDYEQDEHFYLSNGSLHLKNIDDGSSIILDRHSFCILVGENGTAKTLMCGEEDSPVEPEIQFSIYPVFMILSIICLLFTLIAFGLTPEMRNLHGKCIACQSFTLMMAFIGLTVTHLAGTTSHTIVCKLFAYMAFSFLLSSFYWLNTMCFDIFWTFSDFKKMTGSLSQTSKKKFRMYATYATVNPLMILLVTIIFDSTLDSKSSMWPGIGDMKCWFRNHSTEFMFFHIHLLIMLLANTVFFVLTLIKITKMKKEAQVLKRGDSMTHGGGTSAGIEDRQRLALYVKLFLLMGGTWMLEIISWAAHGNPKWFWIPFDIINSSRGILIFVFCVITNHKVRTSLMRRICQKCVKSDHRSNEPRSYTSKMSATSDVSFSHDDAATVAPLCELSHKDTPV